MNSPRKTDKTRMSFAYLPSRSRRWALALLVIVHVAAALKHQFVDRDGLLSRMWPARA